jgi:hypothetical protein
VTTLRDWAAAVESGEVMMVSVAVLCEAAEWVAARQ